MAILLITHDLGIVADMADRLAVMYAGQLVEEATRERFYCAAAHPYSRKPFDSLPAVRKRAQALATIPGTVPPLNRDFTGCRFADRCDAGWDYCRDRVPAWNAVTGRPSRAVTVPTRPSGAAMAPSARPLTGRRAGSRPAAVYC